MHDATWLTEAARSIRAAPPAYLDPGSGSFLLQLLLAGILGGAFIVRSQWTRIRAFFRRRFHRGPSSDENGQ